MTNRFLQRTLWTLALPVCVLLAGDCHAHPGHSHALSEKQAVARGKAVVRSLVENGETVNGEILDESWADSDGGTSCAATQEYYLISLENDAESRTVHVLLQLNGKFLRAGFDAEFAELKHSSFPLQSCDQR